MFTLERYENDYAQSVAIIFILIESIDMRSIIYLVGLVVVVYFILSFLGVL
jgi:hypothetical protein